MLLLEVLGEGYRTYSPEFPGDVDSASWRPTGMWSVSWENS